MCVYSIDNMLNDMSKCNCANTTGKLYVFRMKKSKLKKGENVVGVRGFRKEFPKLLPLKHQQEH